MVIGGNQLKYSGDAGTPTADLLTIKLLANSIVSTKKHKDANKGPERFLPQHVNETIRIHTNQDVGHTG